MTASRDESPRIAAFLSRLSLAAGAFAAGVGGLVLLGWALDVPLLKSIYPNLVSMKANTALGFVLAGLALCALQNERRPAFSRRLAQGSALVVALLGALVMGQYLFALDLGIDQLLAADPLGAVGTAFPGRVAPTTALDFTLIGSALLLLDRETRRGHRPAQWLALAAGFVAVLTFVGQVFSNEAFLGVGRATQVAVHTMLASLALCAGLLFARPGRGLMRVVSSVSGSGKMARRMLPATILAPLVLAGLALSGQRAGLYGAGFAMTLFATTQIALLAGLTWWTAGSLFVAESEQRQADARLRALLDGAPDAMVTVDGAGRIAMVNRECESLFGYRREELIGQRIDILVPERFRASVVAERDLDASATAPRIMSPGLVHYSRRKDGVEFPVEITLSPMETDAGRLVIAAVRDITERKRLEDARARAADERKKMEAQLVLSERMASMGTLAAGVAHEINNPLGAAMANLQVASKLVADVLHTPGAPAQLVELDEVLTEAREGAERVRQIVRDLKIFTRSEEDNVSRVDVHRVLDSTLRMAWNEVRHRARLVKDYGTIEAVAANEGRLGQVFLNLVMNAAQAIPEGRAESNAIRVATRMDERGRVVIEVRDTGPGIPPDIQKQLFTPFFTTKPIGTGTGLGLSICHRIVSALGGEIEVESPPGEGAVFRVSLPPAGPADAALPPAPISGAPAPTRRGRILIIDDDVMVAKAVSRLLAKEHDVLIAIGAVDAMTRLRAGERFDVILCDLMMPDVTGMDFYGLLQALAPEQAERVIFITGGAFTPKARAFLDEVPNARLEKPVDSQNLRALVRDRVKPAAPVD